MKIYFHLCIEEFTNCYVIVNDDPDVMEAVIIDPGTVTNQMLSQIESGGFKLTGVLVTHNHTNHIKGIKTLCKIYDLKIFAADFHIPGIQTVILNGDGEISAAGFDIQYFSIPGHSPDSMVFKIGNVLFTGDTLFSGILAETSNLYSRKMLRSQLEKKILSQTDDTVIMPGHGPPSTVGAEKQFNIDVNLSKSN